MKFLFIRRILKLFYQQKRLLYYQWRSKEFYYHFNSKFSSAYGVLENKRELPLIISLTTIPERIHKVYLCIETLLRQSTKPDYIILWLSKTISKDSIPESLKRLKSRGLHIRFCKDIGPYTKLIYALKENPQDIIITADDDVFYPKKWLEQLYEAYQKEPQYIYCHRGHLMVCKSNGKLRRYKDWNRLAKGIVGPSPLLFPTGCAGVLYPPGSLYREVINDKIFMRICPTGDDIWFKAMSLLNGVACKKVAPFSREFMIIKGTQVKTLYKRNVIHKKNDKQIKATFEHYDLYRSLCVSSKSFKQKANNSAEFIRLESLNPN